MWVHHCIPLLLLGTTFVNASPAWFYNTGSGSPNPSATVGCSSFTKEYDPFSGRLKYRCNPNIVRARFLGSSITTSNGAKAPYTTRTNTAFQNTAFRRSPATAFQNTAFGSSGRSRSGSGPLSSKVIAYPRYQAFGSLREGRAENRCPPGQIFQSELNICIPDNLGPPLPPPRDSRLLNSFAPMLGDAPARPSSSTHQRSRQMTPREPRWEILSVGKFDVKNRCEPHEILVSELDICLPINNCYPYGTTC